MTRRTNRMQAMRAGAMSVATRCHRTERRSEMEERGKAKRSGERESCSVGQE